MFGGSALCFSCSISCASGSVCFGGIVRTEFHQQEAASFGKQLQVGRTFLPEAVDDAALKAFEADGLNGRISGT